MAFPFGSKAFQVGATKIDSDEIAKIIKNYRWFAGRTHHRFLDKLREARAGREPVVRRSHGLVLRD